MIYRFAICDDELSEINYLKQLVIKWANMNRFMAEVTCFPSAETFLFQYYENKSFDILLLDIEMGSINGVELAKKIRAENREVQIIFVTGYMDYITDGYDVEALHYLLKPVIENKFFNVLDRAIVKLNRNESALLLEISGESIRIPLYDIRFLEVQHNYVSIHEKDTHTVKTTLGEIEKELDNHFFRTGRSFIVNLKYVRRITKTDVYLSDGTAIPLSRGLYDAINKAIIEHF